MLVLAHHLIFAFRSYRPFSTLTSLTPGEDHGTATCKSLFKVACSPVQSDKSMQNMACPLPLCGCRSLCWCLPPHPASSSWLLPPHPASMPRWTCSACTCGAWPSWLRAPTEPVSGMSSWPPWSTSSSLSMWRSSGRISWTPWVSLPSQNGSGLHPCWCGCRPGQYICASVGGIVVLTSTLS